MTLFWKYFYSGIFRVINVITSKAENSSVWFKNILTVVWTSKSLASVSLNYNQFFLCTVGFLNQKHTNTFSRFPVFSMCSRSHYRTKLKKISTFRLIFSVGSDFCDLMWLFRSFERGQSLKILHVDQFRCLLLVSILNPLITTLIL